MQEVINAVVRLYNWSGKTAKVNYRETITRVITVSIENSGVYTVHVTDAEIKIFADDNRQIGHGEIENGEVTVLGMSGGYDYVTGTDTKAVVTAVTRLLHQI